MDSSGIELKTWMNGRILDVSSFLNMAVVLATLAHTIHKQQKIMGIVNPAGIRFELEMNQAYLVEDLKLDYAYLSPEQTGRMNRLPDQRSDLYALGILYYEMFTGQLPFQAQDMEEWVHAHLAINPKSLKLLRPDWAGPLDEMIMKLLAKEPEERYQSAYGLLFDLNRCLYSLTETGEIAPFEIACADEANRFRLPRMLFAREKEEEELRRAFAAAQAGASAFVLVSGLAGIGKTALIQGLQESVTSVGARFISSKCDLMNHDMPFAPLLQALQKLMQHIWSESLDKVAELKNKLAGALGQGAGVIAELLPEAAMLLGDFPAVEPLPSAEAAVRLRRLLPVFIKAFAGKEYPLVLFLDDLQWADPATLDVIRTLAHDPSLQGILLIGTFRTEILAVEDLGGEDTTSAAFWMENTLSLQMEEASIRLRHIALEPLSLANVHRFTAFVLHENSDRIRVLAESLYQRTGGNPFHLHRLLDSLYREKKLYYDQEQAIWMWDAAVVKQMSNDPDILHLIGSRLHLLPHETLDLLAIAGAMGHRFRPATLALVSGQSLQATFKLLRFAVEEGLIRRENDVDEEGIDDCYYAFLHDRVQQAAYSNVLDSDKPFLHLKIGRVLLSQSPDLGKETIFDMVHHLNLGSPEIVDEAEKRELAECNLQAGLKAKMSTAFQAAIQFLEKGLQLLGEAGKAGKDPLAYRFMFELPECEYMTGHVDRAGAMLDRLMALAHDRVERSRIYVIRIRMNAFLKRDAIAVEVGLQALAEFGWEIPMKPSKTTLMKELALAQLTLYRKRDELSSLPLNREPEYDALTNLIMAISASAHVLYPEMSTVLNAKFIRYGLKHGNNEAFAFTLCAYGFVLVYQFFPLTLGFRYIETANLLSSSFGSMALQCRLHFLKALALLSIDPEESNKHFDHSVRFGLESAELVFVGLAVTFSIFTHMGDMPSLSAKLKRFEEATLQLQDQTTMELFRIAKWYIAEMQGESHNRIETDVPGRAIDFNKIYKLETFYICTCHMEIAYLTERYREVFEWREIARNTIYTKPRLQERKQRVYQCLSLAALYVEAKPNEQKTIRAQIRKDLHDKKLFVGYYGPTSSAYLLIRAEYMRIEGNGQAAIKGFEEAITSARGEGNKLMEAIACERASLYYREVNIVTAADALLTDACSAYGQWGAVAKVGRLKATYPELSQSASVAYEDYVAAAGEDGLGTKLEQYPTEESFQGEGARDQGFLLDNGKVDINQMAEWPRSADRQEVMSQFLATALRFSGAERGYVLSRQDEVFFIEAEQGGMDAELEGVSYAEAIVRYVVRTDEPVVVANASQSIYATDPYIRRYRPQSILSMSVLFPGHTQASVLYLENNLISSVFTKDRLEVLDMMIARMYYLKSLEDSRIVRSETSDLDNGSERSPLITSSPLIDPLTNREKEILQLLTAGLSNKEIAIDTQLTEGTVKSHIFNIYGKLQVKRRGQAINAARELHLLD
ncbi:AAA family ATPase [Paenibacillus psychroresistens]|nr:AAA family ATPase [Paenibacillus psychroresistens]